ncbi:hypothetical protein [Altericista sp. CCNU0014]|uniref:hypothetical protein n=1 Tax=Altericista sp. CCNU0014 TaxID=3082949 RepID=UPI00384A58FD
MPVMKRWGSILLSICLCGLLLFSSGCASQPPSSYAKVQQETTQRGAPKAIAKDATQGSQFNKYFPKSANGYERVYVQEKKGFAEAKLNKDGKNVAMLSISDTKSLPSAAQKYASSTTDIAGFPSLEIGATQTGILVGDRYQVKVLSRDPSFTKAERQAWIQNFDLNGLSKLR